MPRSLSILFAAPHRLAFLTGSTGLLMVAAWWLAQLAAQYLGRPALPQGELAPALLHPPAMIFFALGPFVFGFLLTVFPRWMGQADLTPRQFGPAAVLFALAGLWVQVALWSGHDRGLPAAFGLAAAGWILALAALGKVIARDFRTGNPPCWHGYSALVALLIGLCALLINLGALLAGRPDLILPASRLAISGFVLPMFLTIAHRMVPFFAGMVVPGYERWRPDLLLALLWALFAALILGQLERLPWLAVAGAGGLAAATLVMTWKWWPRGSAPGLLMVLFLGLTWAPPGFALTAMAQFEPSLSRAGDHALLIGLCGTLLVGMVTRVTHGHSGRALAMTPLAWLAIAAVQLAALLRIAAALRAEHGVLLVLAGLAFTAGLLPWLVRNTLIYIRPRLDGRPG
jgi:uncharacterized protein involved in response to NO